MEAGSRRTKSRDGPSESHGGAASRKEAHPRGTPARVSARFGSGALLLPARAAVRPRHVSLLASQGRRRRRTDSAPLHELSNRAGAFRHVTSPCVTGETTIICSVISWIFILIFYFPSLFQNFI